jgi:phosphoribosylanthranilate isomerase
VAKVKICGLRTPDAVAAAVEAGADWLGFVFFARSPRAVGATQAADLIRPVAGRAGAVGLFVDPTENEVAAVLREATLDILQIYADSDRAMALRRRFGLPVWHAVGVAVRSDLPETSPFDALLIEARPPEGSDRPGGNGTGFDWSIARGWQAPAPWLLAGGLDPQNVAAAIAASGAVAVDVSSGVERTIGVKDPDRIRRFVQAAKRA